MLLLVNMIIIGIVAFFCYSLETIEQSDIDVNENKNRKSKKTDNNHNKERYKDV